MDVKMNDKFRIKSRIDEIKGEIDDLESELNSLESELQRILVDNNKIWLVKMYIAADENLVINVKTFDFTTLHDEFQEDYEGIEISETILDIYENEKTIERYGAECRITKKGFEVIQGLKDFPKIVSKGQVIVRSDEFSWYAEYPDGYWG